MNLNKSNIILYIISIIILLIIFGYIAIDLRRPGNRFVQQRNRNQYQVNKTNIGILLYDLKESLNKGMYKVQLNDFYEDDIEYSGYKLVLIKPSEQEFKSTLEFFEDNDFEINKINDKKTILLKDSILCKIEEDNNNNLNINCGVEK